MKKKVRDSAKAPRKNRVLIIDDHVMVREGVAEIIEHAEDLCVCGTASTVNEGLTDRFGFVFSKSHDRGVSKRRVGCGLGALWRRPARLANGGVSGEDCRAPLSLLLAGWRLVDHVGFRRAGAASSAARRRWRESQGVPLRTRSAVAVLVSSGAGTGRRGRNRHGAWG